MITESLLTKIIICPSYNFNEKKFHQKFIIDLENKKAYWKNDNKWLPLSKIIHEGQESGDKLYSDLTKTLTLNEYPLNKNNLYDFKEKLFKIGFIEQLESMEKNLIKDFNFKDNEEICEDMKNNLLNVDLVKKYHITLQTSTEEKEYIINFDIPEMFLEFMSLITDLVGYDVLNIKNSKYFINPMDYDLKKDGIYEKESDEKLELKKCVFKFNPEQTFGSNAFVLNFITFEEKLLELIENEKIIFNGDVDEVRKRKNYEIMVMNDNNINRRKITPEDIEKFKEILIKNKYIYGV